MSALEQIAYFLNIRNEKPNQELAKKLADNDDEKGIAEIVEGLSHQEKNIQSDCIKVLYETGYLKPELISAYANEFIALLQSKNNRMVWGGMIALMTIAEISPQPLLQNLDFIIETINKGSVITKDAGIKAIALAVSSDKNYRKKYSGFFIDFFEHCLPKDVPRMLDHMTPIISKENKEAFANITKSRLHELKPSQLKKVAKIAKKLELSI
jgi:hypothetical protein